MDAIVAQYPILSVSTDLQMYYSIYAALKAPVCSQLFSRMNTDSQEAAAN
jgi:hypothetical protein